MLKNTETSVKESVLASLRHYLKRVFNEKLAEWICTYWEVVDQSQLDLMATLSRNSTGTDYNVMMLSLFTVTSDIKTFIIFSSAFIETAPLSVELIFSCTK